MKIKIVLLGVAAILVLGLAAAAFWWQTRPQVITFSDDAKVTLLAVEYGKRHAPPGVKAPATTATNRPTAGRRAASTFTTTNDTLVLWVRQEYDSQQYHYFQYLIGDKANTACVQTYGRNTGARQGNEVVAVQVDAFPRRAGKFYVRVQEQGNGGSEIADKKFAISNPLHGSLAKWTAEPLPATKTDDDLSVTLTKLAAGVQMPYNRGDSDADDPLNKGVAATFHVERNGKPMSNWQPVAADTFDATGNHVAGWVNSDWVNQNGGAGWPNGDGTLTWQYGLWPDEPSWKVRFEFSQQSDFTPDELWSVQNVPVQPGRQQDFWNYNARRNATNNAIAETDLNGIHVKVFPAKEFTDVPPNSQPQGGLVIQTDQQLADGMRMTVKVTDDQTNNIDYWQNGWSRNGKLTLYRYSLRDVGGLTNLNVSIALHKSRFVEFTAKPAMDTAPVAAQ